MHWQLIGGLIRLRYKLLWARTRTRNGKVALFFVGYLLFVLLAALLGAGGIGAGMAAVRSGKAELVARIVLTSLFIQTLLATVIMGFGLNAIFSDTELRRYPVTATERLLVRHVVAIVDPFWFFVLALELGLLVGLYVMGAGSVGLGLVAILLLFVGNYLFARVFGSLIDRAMQNKGGAGLVMVLILVVAMGAPQIPVLIKRYPKMADAALEALRFSPPFGAAAAITASGLEAGFGIAVLVAWLLGLGVALVALERRPAQRSKAASTVIAFDSWYDRAASWFGRENAPLIAFWWRFYARNNRFRVLTLASLPLIGFLTWNFGRRGGGSSGLFVAALGTFPLLTFLGPSRFTVNQFGYVGGGFRRYLLLPTDCAAALRAGSRASMLIAAPLIPLAAVAWVALAPVPFDPRMLFMLVASAVTGMFVFHGLGLWATIFGPRKGNYGQSLGNDLSLLGNLVLLGGIFTFLFVPQLLAAVAPALVAPANWWIAVAPVTLAAVFYAVSLSGAESLFKRRREQLMSVVEGRG